MTHFYATAEDLLPVLAAVEQKLSVRYTSMGQHRATPLQSWRRGSELPTIGQPLVAESAVLGPAYLVTPGEMPAKARRLPAASGESGWLVDQLENPDSTVLWHGGRHGEHVLLYGRVDTASHTVIARRLQRAYESAIRKSFTRIQGFHVGKGAEVLLDAGVRLTIAVQSPVEYDLSRPRDGV